MSKEKARIAIIDQNSGKKYQVQLPTNVPVEKILPPLVKKLNLPKDGPGGAPIEYDIALASPEGNIRLEENKTLAEEDIQDGAVLRITPRMTGG